jgi:hypothetical protein
MLRAGDDAAPVGIARCVDKQDPRAGLIAALTASTSSGEVRRWTRRGTVRTRDIQARMIGV